MRRSIQTTWVAFVSAIVFTASYVGYGQRIVRDGIYNKIVTIKGHVEVRVSSLEPLRGSGAYLVFQRDGCNDCLVATHADASGDYKILVGRGRYRLIVYNPSRPNFDLLAPDQPRYIDAVPRLQDTQFDIKLIAVPER